MREASGSDKEEVYVRQFYLSFRRLLFAIGAFAVCLLALAGFAANALGVDGYSTTGRHRTLVARAEEPALAFIVALGCLFTASATLRGHRRKPPPNEAQVKQLAAQARTDSLTGLGNHRAFEESLSQTIAARASTGAPFVLLALDVDGLKELNDTHGHLAGDARIKLVANCVREVVGTSGTVHRTGGDEFMVILPGCRNWHGLELARTIDESTRATSGGRTVSIGLTESVGTEGRHLLVGQADLALYEAKRTKLNAVVFNAGLATSDDVPRLAHGPSRDQRALAAALARAVDAKDVGTQSHSETVAQLCVAIAERLGIAGERLERIRIAGLLHDVGKIGVADAILQKPGALDNFERRAMDDHVEVGHGIIMAAELFEEAEWVLHHHERYDGTGYPAGQRAGEIPLESRIISVADAFEAMTSDRPYRTSVTDERALSELRAHTGTQFDGRCVNALVEVISEAEPSDLWRPSEIAERVDRSPVHPHLEVEVRPEAVPRAADVADDLALRDRLA
jgi:diguanylate cyclase (GGDEF)-like protein